MKQKNFNPYLTPIKKIAEEKMKSEK